MTQADNHQVIVLVEDDIVMRDLWKKFLTIRGYNVLAATRVKEGIRLVKDAQPDLVIVDWMLPDGEGTELCEQVRQSGFTKPIVLFTCKTDTDSVVTGLAYGANDYWFKPMPLKEAAARIQALLRQNFLQTIQRDEFRLGELSVHFSGRRVMLNDKAVELNEKEFGILEYLVAHHGSIVPRARLLASVWKYDQIPETRTVDNYVASLRRKIGDNPSQPTYIETCRGVGYRLVATPEVIAPE